MEHPPDIEDAENIPQLNYLGMRMAFGAERSERSLRALARSCAKRREATKQKWEQLPPLSITGKEHLQAAVKAGRGAILCLPHVGPYFRIPFDLLRDGIPTTMVSDSANYRSEVAAYPRWRELYQGSHPDPLRYIDAEAPMAAWHMMRDLGEGRSLCLWYDANVGLGDAERAETSVPIQFCGLDIFVRKGAAHLSFKSKAPMIPAHFLGGRRGGHELHILPPVSPEPAEALDEFCLRAMQELYARLERLVRRDPARWEMWYRLHRWRAPTPAAATANLPPEELLAATIRPDWDRIVALRIHGMLTLVHETTGAAFAETELVASMLNALDGGRTVAELLDRMAFQFGEEETLRALLALASNGFVVLTGQSAA